MIGAVGETDHKKSYAADVWLAMDCLEAENTGSGTCTVAAFNNVVNGDAKLLLLQWIWFNTLPRKSPWASMDRHGLGVRIAADQ